MDVILWGVMWILERTSKVAYWIVFGALAAVLLAVLGWAYLTGHLVR